MAVKIRLTRMGKKKKPQYRVVVADSRNARDGKVIAERPLGFIIIHSDRRAGYVV